MQHDEAPENIKTSQESRSRRQHSGEEGAEGESCVGLLRLEIRCWRSCEIQGCSSCPTSPQSDTKPDVSDGCARHHGPESPELRVRGPRCRFLLKSSLGYLGSAAAGLLLGGLCGAHANNPTASSAGRNNMPV